MNPLVKIGAIAAFIVAPYYVHERSTTKPTIAIVKNELPELGKLEDYESLLPGIGNYKGPDGSLTPEGAKRYFREKMDNGDGIVSCPELNKIYEAAMVLQEKKPLPGNKFEEIGFIETKSGQAFTKFFIAEYHIYMDKPQKPLPQTKPQCRVDNRLR